MFDQNYKDNKNSNEAFIVNEINKIKELINSLRLTDFDRIRSAIASLLSNDNIPPAMLSILNELNFKIDTSEKNKMSIVLSNNLIAEREKNSYDPLEDLINQFGDVLEYAVQEQKINTLKDEYKSFSNSFSGELNSDNKMLEKAVLGKFLTPKEKVKLTGEYCNDEEKIKLEQKWEKKAQKWEKIYSLEEKITESIKNKQEKIVKINNFLETKNISPEQKTTAIFLKKEEQQKINEHTKTLDNIKEKHKKRDKELELISSEKLDRKITNHFVKKHQHIHNKFYEKECLKNPEHKSSKIMQGLVKKLLIEQSNNSGKQEDQQKPNLFSSLKNITRNIESSSLTNEKDETSSNSKSYNLRKNSSKNTVSQSQNTR